MDGKRFKKERVIKALGGLKKAIVFFGCKRQAIYQWPDGEPIPEKRQLELMVRRPDLFPPHCDKAQETTDV